MGLRSQYAGPFLPSASGESSLLHFYGYMLIHPSPFQPINLLLGSADAMFGPITTVRTNGQVTKKIPWSAFQLSEEDWERVKDIKDILTVRVHRTTCLGSALTLQARIPRQFSTISHLNVFPHSGAPFPLLRSCKPHGK
jgi:hypothetical protein